METLWTGSGVGRSSARTAGAACRGAACEDFVVDVVVEGLALEVDAEDGFAALEVGVVNLDAAVEAAGAEEGGVEDVGAVGGGDEDDARVGLEAVHLDEELVEGLLALVVAAADAGEGPESEE